MIRVLMGTNANRRAIPLLRLRAIGIELHEHRVINISTERAFDRFKVRLVAIAGQLDAICEARAKIIHEDDRGITVVATDEPRGDHQAAAWPASTMSLLTAFLLTPVRPLAASNS